MAKVFTECGDPVVGAVVIDWENRKIVWHGMDGCGETTPEEVDAIIKEHTKEGKEVWPLIFWKDQDQLSVHDDQSWGEAFEDEEGEEDEEAETNSQDDDMSDIWRE